MALLPTVLLSASWTIVAFVIPIGRTVQTVQRSQAPTASCCAWIAYWIACLLVLLARGPLCVPLQILLSCLRAQETWLIIVLLLVHPRSDLLEVSTKFVFGILSLYPDPLNGASISSCANVRKFGGGVSDGLSVQTTSIVAIDEGAIRAVAARSDETIIPLGDVATVSTQRLVPTDAIVPRRGQHADLIGWASWWAPLDNLEHPANLNTLQERASMRAKATPLVHGSGEPNTSSSRASQETIEGERQPPLETGWQNSSEWHMLPPRPRRDSGDGQEGPAEDLLGTIKCVSAAHNIKEPGGIGCDGLVAGTENLKGNLIATSSNHGGCNVVRERPENMLANLSCHSDAGVQGRVAVAALVSTSSEEITDTPLRCLYKFEQPTNLHGESTPPGFKRIPSVSRPGDFSYLDEVTTKRSSNVRKAWDAYNRHQLQRHSTDQLRSEASAASGTTVGLDEVAPGESLLDAFEQTLLSPPFAAASTTHDAADVPVSKRIDDATMLPAQLRQHLELEVEFPDSSGKVRSALLTSISCFEGRSSEGMGLHRTLEYSSGESVNAESSDDAECEGDKTFLAPLRKDLCRDSPPVYSSDPDCSEGPASQFEVCQRLSEGASTPRSCATSTPPSVARPSPTPSHRVVLPRSNSGKTVNRIEEIKAAREARRAATEAKKSVARDLKIKGLDPELVHFEMQIESWRHQQFSRAFVAKSARGSRGENRIQVCVRKRPLNTKELSAGVKDVVTILPGGEAVVHELGRRVDQALVLQHWPFSFDFAFDEHTTNADLFEATARGLVDSVVAEDSVATMFAYGQTGSGKTFSMEGSSGVRTKSGASSVSGMYQLSAERLFEQLQCCASVPQSAAVSFVEIYGSKLYDLLDNRSEVRLLEDGRGRTHVVGAKEVVVASEAALCDAIARGSKLRASRRTLHNDGSSRSHAILSVQLYANSSTKRGRYTLVDLAGNERASESGTPCILTRQESAEINKSLLALKECIRTLARVRSEDYAPFRQSKLTMLLRDSFLDPRARVCVLSCISPGSVSSDYTLDTLRYAAMLKDI